MLQLHPLPNSAWADVKLAEVAEQGGKMMELPKSKSTQPKYPVWIVVSLTDVLVDGVDPLDVPRHDVDGGLLGAHLLVEQVVRLQVQHARRLLGVHLLVVLPTEVVPHRLGHVRPVHHLDS